ncbi:glutamine amidotransferases class-II domain-containing protein [Pochonia chlamydosporia 170]|uniref:Glutamine amidotransferases class-II domain-containing protein n=1 Tax=Pochonia chlamydosporia 170 TaxID=1380566 RepID=A0A219APW7_METCM|nr:glutamine amidotransferases class-II domain-containing protein [Pochonia chlamydosporia 170]OWT42866.1 glutamine amidotransferases class-II domain-containing protein [Pochonia chlamydosporia 170]
MRFTIGHVPSISLTPRSRHHLDLAKTVPASYNYNNHSIPFSLSLLVLGSFLLCELSLSRRIMCRFLVYKGSDEILLSKLILDPTHSILKQSFDSRLRLDTRRGQNNADGFGIGFYTDPKLGAAPCLFTSTIPAWNCTNLQRIASKTASRLIFGHVRATTEGSLSEDNCHPFTHASLMWMHNGGLGGWKHIKRKLGGRLADKWFLEVKGGTDSEWAFALFLDTLERLGHDPSSSPESGFGPTVLRKAVEQTIAQINELTDAIPQDVLQNEDVDTRSLLNFAVTDGHSVICTRYISSSKDEAASLYYSSGTQWVTRTADPNDRQYQMERKDKGADIVLVASEPLTFERENWVNVPTNSILTIHRQTVMVHPILDKYYERDPYHVRSSAFVQTKGLISNEKPPSGTSISPGSGTTPSSFDGYRKLAAQTLCSRSLSPDVSRRSLTPLSANELR